MSRYLSKPLEFEFIPPESLPTELVPITVIDKRIDLIHNMLVKGVAKDEIIDRILDEKYPDVKTKLEAFEIVKSVFKDSLFKEHQDTVYTFNLHLARYEDLYSFQMKMENSSGFPLDEKKDLIEIQYKFKEALNVLKQKEELLGLHDKKLIIEINNIHLDKKKKSSGLFSFDQLHDGEKLELLGLLRKLRANANDGVQPFSIIGENEFEEEDVVEVESVEVDDSYETPIDDVVEVSNEDEGAEVKTIDDVKKDIQMSNLDKFKRMLKRAREG